MSSSAERAAELRAQADALDAMAGLENDLLAAKESGDKAAIREASLALREARSQTRTEGTTVGGDAFVSPTSEEV
ncbi:hypothetical protein FXF51_06025 [Nonomuraea sp. PA05]|uniref:hypothetical protein n=1 Tax=Nonomuraea sp. PA05 TaxID=2604466 RepID=UPI0011D36302|nr:hypothetical protein [Nonomuraea sp. PA05]TYB69717.1 hypothetical protein FXF51_06025 [Nonomuraea sp. PA05]